MKMDHPEKWVKLDYDEKKNDDYKEEVYCAEVRQSTIESRNFERL